MYVCVCVHVCLRPGDGGPAAFRWNIERLAWFYRWKFFARAGRLGYNVMNVDSDFVFFRCELP